MSIIVFDHETVLILALSAGVGAFGGFTRWLTDRQQLPRRLVVGAVAALAVMFVARPVDAISLVAGALVAGWGGEAVLASLEARARADIAEKREAEAKKDLKDKTEKLAGAEADVDLAIAAMEGAATPSADGLMGSGKDTAAATTPVVTILLEHRAARCG